MNDCIFYIEGTMTPSQDQIAVEIPALRVYTCGDNVDHALEMALDAFIMCVKEYDSYNFTSKEDYSIIKLDDTKFFLGCNLPELLVYAHTAREINK